MAEKPVMAYVAEPGDIKALMQRTIEKAAKCRWPLSFFAATAGHPIQEMHLGKVIHRVLCETNGRQGLDWVVRQAPENRYFVLLNADFAYLKGLAEQLYEAFESQSLKVSHSLMPVPQNGTPEQMAEQVYEGLCQSLSTPVQDACLSR